MPNSSLCGLFEASIPTASDVSEIKRRHFEEENVFKIMKLRTTPRLLQVSSFRWDLENLSFHFSFTLNNFHSSAGILRLVELLLEHISLFESFFESEEESKLRQMVQE
jgi:hypothetical protein